MGKKKKQNNGSMILEFGLWLVVKSIIKNIRMLPEKEERWRISPVRWQQVDFFRILAGACVARGGMRIGWGPISLIKQSAPLNV